MKYVLDTNAVSMLMKGEPELLAHLRRAEKAAVGIPQPVISEIAYGIARLPASKRKTVLAKRFELVREELTRIAWTDEVSDAFGAIKAQLDKRGETLEDFDVAIAAHAVATSSVLVTGNLAHMTRIPGLKVEDWTR